MPINAGADFLNSSARAVPGRWRATGRARPAPARHHPRAAACAPRARRGRGAGCGVGPCPHSPSSSPPESVGFASLPFSVGELEAGLGAVPTLSVAESADMPAAPWELAEASEVSPDGAGAEGSRPARGEQPGSSAAHAAQSSPRAEGSGLMWRL